MFELYQLRHFVKVVECRTLSAAAEDLHITQPALSRSIRNLEAELNVPLFDRGKNKIELNENGKLAYRLAKRLLAEAEKMQSSIEASDSRRRTIALGSCAPSPLFGDRFAALLAQCFPSAAISTAIIPADRLPSKLRDGEFRFIIYPFPLADRDLYCQPFMKERLFVLIDKKHSLAKAGEGIHFDSLKGRSILLMPLPGYWNDLIRSRIPDAHFVSQTNISDYNEVMRSSSLISFTSDIVMASTSVPGNKTVLPILDPEAELYYSCICLRSDRSLFSSFFSALKTMQIRID